MNAFVIGPLVLVAVTCNAFAAQPLAAAHFPFEPTLFVASPQGTTTLVNQTTGGTGTVILSQDFGKKLAVNDSAGADAFAVPAGRSWKVAQVIAVGRYYDGSGPASSENVTFYLDRKGMPGYAVKGCSYMGVAGADHGGTFTITLPKVCTLRPGTYWVSVVANMAYRGGRGDWGWEDAAETGPYQAEWENPGNGLGAGCTSWKTERGCEPYGQANGKDYVLIGRE